MHIGFSSRWLRVVLLGSGSVLGAIQRGIALSFGFVSTVPLAVDKSGVLHAGGAENNKKHIVETILQTVLGLGTISLVFILFVCNYSKVVHDEQEGLDYMGAEWCRWGGDGGWDLLSNK